MGTPGDIAAEKYFTPPEIREELFGVFKECRDLCHVCDFWDRQSHYCFGKDAHYCASVDVIYRIIKREQSLKGRYGS